MADTIPAGGDLAAAPDLPVPAPPQLPGSSLVSLGPSFGGPGMPIATDPVSGIANAIQSSIGYATRDPQMEQAAIERQKLNDQYRIRALSSAGVAQAADRLAQGDMAGARAILKSNPLMMMTPEGQALYLKTAEQERGIALHRQSVAVLSARDDIPSQIAASYLASDPTMTTKDALSMALTTIGQNKVEKADDGFHIINPSGEQIGFVPAAKIMTKNREQSLVSVGPQGATTLQGGAEQAPIGYLHTQPAPVQEALLRTGGFSQARYDMLARKAANGDASPDEQHELDTWNRIGGIKADIKANPIEWRVAATRLGIPPDQMANPETMPPARAEAWQNAVSNIKTDQEVAAKRGVFQFEQAEKFAPDAYSSLRGKWLINPKTWEMRDAAGIRANDPILTETDANGDRTWKVADPQSAQAAKFSTAAVTGIQAAQRLGERMYAKLGPDSLGRTIAQNWAIYKAKYDASSEDVAAWEALKPSLATEIIKALNPQGRGSDAARKEMEQSLDGRGLATLGTFRARLGIALGEINNRRRTAIGLLPEEIPLPEAPKTHPTLGNIPPSWSR